MDTLKTAAVVVLLLAVLYGAWVVLNGDPNQRPDFTAATDGWPSPDSPPAEAGPPVNLGAEATPLASPPVPVPGFGVEDSTGSPAEFAQIPNGNPGPPLQVPLENPVATPEASVAPPLDSGFVPVDYQNQTPAEVTSTIEGGSDVSPPSDPGFSQRFNQEQSAEDSQWLSAVEHINAGRWREALFTLSLMFHRNDLSPSRRTEVMNLLDPLAAKVIYSREHHLEAPYQVRPNESLAQIAARFQVPWQLLANINGVQSPDAIVPGSELKVVSGPFRAEVQLTAASSGTLTLFLNRMYAGQFSVTVGTDPEPIPGEYQVRAKEAGRNYYLPDGNTIPAAGANNPFGNVWFDLGNQLSIHGSAAQATLDTVDLGCISLSPKDAQDVFGILSKGSSVTIRR